MPVGTKVGAASSGGNIKLRDSIGKVVGPAEYTSSNFSYSSDAFTKSPLTLFE